MEVLDLLKGKKIKYMTDALVEVELTIDSVKEDYKSRDLEPATRENDWYPRSENWTEYIVTFTNGFKKTFRNLNEIKLIENGRL